VGNRLHSGVPGFPPRFHQFRAIYNVFGRLDIDQTVQMVLGNSMKAHNRNGSQNEIVWQEMVTPWSRRNRAAQPGRIPIPGQILICTSNYGDMIE
jgi:hypothetical protein